MSKIGKGSLGIGGISRETYAASGDRGAKYIHCVEEHGEEQGGGEKGEAGNSGVVIEWARRAAATGGGARSGFDVQEVLVKCRVGQFPSQKGFYLLVSAPYLRCLLQYGLGRTRGSAATRSAGRC